MTKEELREQLFNKYFENEDGILITELTEKLSFIPSTWNKLHTICKNNIKYYDEYSSIIDFKVLTHNNINYMIIKINPYRYVIIDLNNKKSITNEELDILFNEDFFTNNFNESNKKELNLFPDIYSIDEYNGNINEIIDFYIENKDTLNLSRSIYYKYEIGKSITSLHIDLINAKGMMNFTTPDQFLYEQLYLTYDINPSSMQDALLKIGKEKIIEMFNQIKNIKVPIEVIPNDLYEQYLLDYKELKLTKNNNE